MMHDRDHIVVVLSDDYDMLALFSRTFVQEQHRASGFGPATTVLGSRQVSIFSVDDDLMGELQDEFTIAKDTIKLHLNIDSENVCAHIVER